MKKPESDYFKKRSKLTNIHLSEYNDATWTVESSDEFDIWFSGLDEQSKEAVFERTLLLCEFGPTLGRPYADTLKGLRRGRNIKELRCQTDHNVLRVAYYFDSDRNAFLLIGGDKKGINETRFYSTLITVAEGIVERHEKELANEKRNQNDGR